MDARITRCPLCGAAAERHPEPLGEHGRGEHTLWVCSHAACGAGFLSPQPTDDELARAYSSEYYGVDGEKLRAPLEVAMARFARTLARDILHQARPETSDASGVRRILDVGCGRGVLVRALLDVGEKLGEEAGENVEVHGFERTREAARGLDARAHLHVGERLSDLTRQRPELAGSFSAVVWRHVLEHVRDPMGELAASRALLRPGGLLVVEVPHFGGAQARFGGAQWFHLDPPRHLFHFSEASLRTALARSGFAIVGDVRRTSWSQDSVGWVQSALHRMGRPHNAFFDVLRRGGPLNVVDVALGASLVPAALVATVADGALAGGGTLTVFARASARATETAGAT